MPYAHLAFTLPHRLNALYGAHPRWVIDTLFAATAQTLSEFAVNLQWLRGTTGAMPAFSLVLQAARHKALYHHPWVIYARTPMGGSAQVLQALGMPIAVAKALESAADFMRRIAKVDVLCCPRPMWGCDNVRAGGRLER